MNLGKRVKIAGRLKRYILGELYQYYENKAELEAIEDEENKKTTNETGIVAKNKTSRPTEQEALHNISRKSSRYLLAVERKVRAIDKVYDRLNEDEQKLFDLIFKEGYSQKRAEVEGKASYDTYYNTQKKILYLTAYEFGEIAEL